MYQPATRVLTVLELLQTHGRLSGPELAARLEVDVRTVRRYVTMLQDLGIPVEGERGRHGAYRLLPSSRLPPLMFTEDEAIALVIGLLAVRGSHSSPAAVGVGSALTKVERVMPRELRERVRAVEETVVVGERSDGSWPVGGAIGSLSDAVRRRQRVRLRYRSERGTDTEREFDPYGLLYRHGRWYLAGYCHLRREMRTLRADRVLVATLCPEPFTPPPDFDIQAFVEQSLAMVPRAWSIEVLLETTMETARRRMWPGTGTLQEVPDGVVFRGEAEDLDVAAHILAGLGCRFRVRQPPELRDALRRLASHVAELAGAEP